MGDQTASTSPFRFLKIAGFALLLFGICYIVSPVFLQVEHDTWMTGWMLIIVGFFLLFMGYVFQSWKS